MGDTVTKAIGDTSRDGTLQIMDTNWDSNGTLEVTVRDSVGAGNRIGGLNIPAMRRLARTALMYPEKTRSARVTNRFVADGCIHITFAVSRLAR